jgi:RNA polymerase sigma-70 factor (ECF subfamily)
MNSKQETRWVLRAQTGDNEALDEIFKSIQAPLFRYLNVLTGNSYLAEEILQDVFLTIYRKIRWLNEPQFFRAWTYRIATREAFKHLKRERRWLEQIRDEAVLEAIPDESKPEEFEPDLKAQLPELLEKLSPASRAVIALHYLQELTIEESAAVLKIAVGTAKSRLAYGLASLRQQIKNIREKEQNFNV